MQWELEIAQILRGLESSSQHCYQMALNSLHLWLYGISRPLLASLGTCVHTSLHTNANVRLQGSVYLEVRVTAEMQATCRDCLNRNGSYHSRLGRQGKASKAQLRSVVGLETGKGGGKEPWRSQASKVEESLFQHSHRTLIAISNFIEKFNEQIIVSNPFVPLIDSTPPPTPSTWVTALKIKGPLCLCPSAIKNSIAFKTNSTASVFQIKTVTSRIRGGGKDTVSLPLLPFGVCVILSFKYHMASCSSLLNSFKVTKGMHVQDHLPAAGKALSWLLHGLFQSEKTVFC